MIVGIEILLHLVNQRLPINTKLLLREYHFNSESISNNIGYKYLCIIFSFLPKNPSPNSNSIYSLSTSSIQYTLLSCVSSVGYLLFYKMMYFLDLDSLVSTLMVVASILGLQV